MVINKQKTQVLSISSSQVDNIAYLTDDNNTRITSETELKMLGFYFSEKPTVHLQVEKLLRRANKRIYLLLTYKKNGVPKGKLKTIYTSNIRSVLEYTCNTYHSQLNRGQINLIERAQKRCLKIIYGYTKSYVELLNESGLETMEARRVRLFEKFTKKTADNPKYNAWFPQKDCIRDTRKPRPYVEERATSQRLYRSPIYAMRRLLNDEPAVEIDPSDLTGLYNAP